MQSVYTHTDCVSDGLAHRENEPGEEYLPFMDGGWLTCWAGLCFDQTGNAYLISWCNCLYWWESGQLNSVVVCWMSDDASERVQSSEE